MKCGYTWAKPLIIADRYSTFIGWVGLRGLNPKDFNFACGYKADGLRPEVVILLHGWRMADGSDFTLDRFRQYKIPIVEDVY